MDLGQLRIDPVVDGAGRFRPTLTFRGTTDAQWEAHRDLLDADGLLGFTIGSFLIRDGERTVLVDTGYGTGQILGIDCGGLLDDLARQGVQPADVTDVVYTHLHVDHIGWSVRDGAPVFPNATHHAAQADVDHFIAGGTPEGEHLAPVRDRFAPWDGSGPILPGIDAMPAPGHTPGSTVIVVSSATDRALLLGDVVHCPVQLLDDEWGALFDVDPELARRTRNRLARELEGADAAVAGAHFPGLRFGRLVRGEGRRRWVV